MNKEIVLFTMIALMAGFLMGFITGKEKYKAAVVKNCLQAQIPAATCRQYTDFIENGK